MWWLVVFTWIFIVHAEPEVTPTTTTDLVQNQESEDSEVTTIGYFTNVSHGLRSDEIMVLGQNVLEIPHFYFDGTAQKAYFLVGKGEVSENGTIVYLDNSTSPLPAFNGQSVTLIMPEGLTIKDVDWLAVWCFELHISLGHVFIKDETSTYPPQTFGLKDVVSSSRVVFMNKNTFFIPNFRYNGGHSNVHFWVGNGSEPSPEGVQLPDEKGSDESLQAYQGQNLYITLPNSITTDNIEYFGVWSKDEKISLGWVSVKTTPELSDAPVQATTPVEHSEKIVMTLPKCCDISLVLGSKGCLESSEVKFEPKFKIYEHNDTHFSNESLNLSLFVFKPYYSTPNCKSGMYPLDNTSEEEFALLQNGSLLIKSPTVSGILQQDKFCLDNAEVKNDTSMTILICVPEHEIQTAMSVTYVTLTVISTICFAGAFVLYSLWITIVDIHRKCFAAYAFTMTGTFLALTIVQLAHISSNSSCATLGFIFQVFTIASFTLLGILCVDIFIIIKYIDDNKFAEKRKWCYIIIALSVPILFLIISLCRNLTPDVPNSFFKPQYSNNNCQFEAGKQRLVIFYIPICLSILTSAVFLVLTKIAVIRNDKEKESDYYWIQAGKKYKFMFRQCVLTLIIMTVSWISNVLTSFIDPSSGVVNAAIIIEALQGVIIVAVFSMHHYGSHYMGKRRVRNESDVEMSPLNS